MEGMADMMTTIEEQRRAIETMKPDGTFDLNPDYKAILKLDKRLTEAGIPHLLDRANDGWIILYPSYEHRVGDAIQHYYSYGAFHDLIEVFGFGLKNPDGFLDVDAAFDYFKKAHDKMLEKERRRSAGKVQR